VGHKAPWDWRVSLYTWTKGISAGAYLVAAGLIVLGLMPDSSALWRWAAPLLATIFLIATGGLLIGDLTHPTRFYYLFVRPQWRSWLVRGAVIITGYGAALGAHILASFFELDGAQRWLALAGAPLAVLTAIYTAYLFAQAKARDLWQSALLPSHLLVQAVLSGAAALLLVAAVVEHGVLSALLWTLGGTCAAHLLLVAGEATLTHPTAHARLAAWEMVHGRYRSYFWVGVALTLGGVLAPWIGVAAAPLALAGLLAHEHAYVQAGQSVPLA
jgi:formate-dependent nitrite reductase membrane component NrfD